MDSSLLNAAATVAINSLLSQWSYMINEMSVIWCETTSRLIYRSQRSRSLSRRSAFDRAVGRREVRTLHQSTTVACTRRTRSMPDGTCDRELCAPSPSVLELADTWNTWTPQICTHRHLASRFGVATCQLTVVLSYLVRELRIRT